MDVSWEGGVTVTPLRTYYDQLAELNLHGWLRSTTWPNGEAVQLNHRPDNGEPASTTINPEFAAPNTEPARTENRQRVEIMLRGFAADPATHKTIAELERYRRRNNDANPYVVRALDLHNLYALSRLSDWLLFSFQGCPGEPAPYPAISLAAYVEFFEAFGFQTIREARYSPFFHEIVEVEPADHPASGIELIGERWPGLMFGNMLFARAGVRVRAHPSLVRPDIGTTTTLYWSHMRWHRQTSDESNEWGSNSQWSTFLRRDYIDDTHYHFNVDADISISGGEPLYIGGYENPFVVDLPLIERRVLLINRCFPVDPAPADEDDQFPYEDRLTVRRDDPLVG